MSALLWAAVGSVAAVRVGYAQVVMDETVIDSAGPADPWGKAIGDIDGDGRPDLVIGGHGSGGLVYYANPSWSRYTIDAERSFGTDLEIEDLDGDGDMDVVAITAEDGLIWYEAPHWTPHPVADVLLHDIELEDFDADGDLDIAGRNQGEFGQSGAVLYFIVQQTPTSWSHVDLPVADGEGLATADLDRDGDADVVLNGRWIENPGGWTKDDWIEHVYAPQWHPNSYVAVGDLNGDARLDIITSPSELQGDRFRISWFEAPPDPAADAWIEHVVEPDVETVYHFIGVADFDLDDDLDIAAAEMHQSDDPDVVKLYLNSNSGAEWTEQVISRGGSHSMRIADVDGDGDPDLLGANWQGREVKLWRNGTARREREQGNSRAQPRERPNVVLIMTDDQGYGDFSRHGNPILETPHMDALAEESIRFTDFHVANICTPTRSQLLTGLDALRTGANAAHGQRHLLKRGIPTMADIFLLNGYRTAMYGKWHLGGNFYDFMPHERGFEDAVWFLRGGVQSSPNYWNSDLKDDYLYHNGRLKQYGGYATDVWFDLGEEFIERMQDAGEPFFLYLPLNAPHGPHLVQDRYRKPYTGRGLDKTTETFFGMIAGVDDRLGEFIEFLEAEGVRDDTILIFLTDNGTANGNDVFNAGMRGRKTSPYDGGHRVPLFISWPSGDLAEPRDVDALVHVQDLLPTLVDLLQLTPPPGHRFDGVSLVPSLKGREQPVLAYRILVAQRRDEKGSGTVMWRKWRLVGDELYDVREDPGQQMDVAERHPNIVDRLRDHYEAWWSGVEPHLDLEPYRIPAEKEVKLTAYDWWYGPRVYNWPHLRRGDTSNGRFEVLVDEAGTYEVSLRRWPRESGYGIREGVPRFVPFDDYMAYDDDTAPFPPGEALEIRNARVRFGGSDQSVPVEDGVMEATFRFELPAGETDLQTWFTTAGGRAFGAHYVYIRKL